MKRYLITVAAVLALLVPAVAAASVKHFSGPVVPSGSVSFTAMTRPAKVVKVRPGFTFTHIPMTCDQGPETVSGNFDFAMRVKHRHFHGTGIYTGGGRVAVAGTFTHHGRKANGTISISGDFSATGVTGCSANHNWRAHRA
jgi:hypothetical protein